MIIFEAIILSIVEGLTEFLPISSTGHLVLASNLLQIPQTEFVKTFEIVIQLGAIMAVVWLYWKQLLNYDIWRYILAAFFPTAILGFIFYDFIKQDLLGNLWVTLSALCVGGVLMIILDKIKTKSTSLNIQRAMAIGLFQSVSMIPGVSRAAATIIGGRLLGLSKEESVKFSFFLAIPTMLAASGYDLVKTNYNFSPNDMLILFVGFVGSFVTALIAIKFLIQFIKNHDFTVFGIYRIALAVLWLVASATILG